MLALRLADLGRPPTVLCIGAHCDDIEIGCGATLLRWSQDYPGARFIWAVFSGEPERREESSHALLEGCIVHHGFDCYVCGQCHVACKTGRDICRSFTLPECESRREHIVRRGDLDDPNWKATCRVANDCP